MYIHEEIFFLSFICLDDKDGQISFKDFRRVFARRASMTHSELKDMNQLYENSGNIDHDINEPP